MLGMTVYREDDRQVFLHAGQQGVALFEKEGGAPLTAGNDLNHLASTWPRGPTRPSRPSWRGTA